MSIDVSPTPEPPVTMIHRGTLQSNHGNIEVVRVTVMDGYEWAVVSIDDTKLLTIHSTHGEWSAKWNGIDATSFAAWILERKSDYLLRKLNYGRSTVFAIDKTVSAIKQHIIALRRRRTIASVDARDMWDEAETIDNEQEFWQYHDSDLPGRDCEECLVMEYPQGLQNFMSEQWPLVQKALQVVVAEFAK